MQLLNNTLGLLFSRQMISRFTALVLLVASVPPGFAQDKPDAAMTKIVYVVEPQRLARGEAREVLIKTEPASDLRGVTVEALVGSGISVERQDLLDDNQTLAVKLNVRGDTSLGSARLKVTDSKKQVSSVSLTITDIEPVAKRPTPGGISEVDAAWLIQPDQITEGNFGRYVAHNFYCIEVTVGNNTGYDLEIARVSFEGVLNCVESNKADAKPTPPTSSDCNNKAKTKFPVSNYKLVRGMIERGQQVGRRNTMINVATSLGILLTGFIPFYGNIRPKAHFTAFTNIVNGPFKEGLALSFPDTTIRQLSRLGDQALQNSIIIDNNSSVAFTVFLPKDIFHFSDAIEKNQPWSVMPRLGQLVLVGNLIESLNRTIVMARPNPPLRAPDENVSPSTAPTAKPEEKATKDKKDGEQPVAKPPDANRQDPRSSH